MIFYLFSVFLVYFLFCCPFIVLLSFERSTEEPGSSTILNAPNRLLNLRALSPSVGEMVLRQVHFEVRLH